MSRKIYAYTNFMGGLSEKAPDNMAENELTAADNILLTGEGGFTIRPGTVIYNDNSNVDMHYLRIIEFPLSSGTVRLLGLRRNYTNGQYVGEYTLCDLLGETKINLQNVLTESIGYFAHNNRFYFGDGNKLYVYGDYKYSTQSGTSINVKTNDIVKNQPISTNSTQSGVLGHFYKAKADMSAVDLSAAPYGDTTKWIDCTLDLSIPGYTGTPNQIPLDVREVVPNTNAENDLNPIKKCKYFLYHTKSHRIFAAGNPDDKAALYYSEPDEPTFFKATSRLYPTMGDGIIKGIKQVGETVVVAYSHSWWGWEGIEPTTATWGRYPIPHGLVNNEAFILTPGSFTFLSNDGLYSVSTAIMNRDIVMAAGEQLINKISDKKVDKIISKIRNHEYTSMAFHDSMIYLGYSEIPNSLNNEYTLVCNWDNKSFVRYTGWNTFNFLTTISNELIFGSKNCVLKVDEKALNDIGENLALKPIHMYVETKHYNWDNPINQKILHNFFIWSSQNVDAGNKINLTLKVDFAKTTFPLDLNTEIFIWGQQWGSVWGSADIAPQMAILHKKGIRCQVIFDSKEINTRNSVVVYGVAFEVEHLRARTRAVAYQP